MIENLNNGMPNICLKMALYLMGVKGFYDLFSA